MTTEEACVVCRDPEIVVHMTECSFCALCFSAVSKVIARWQPAHSMLDVRELIDSLRRNRGIGARGGIF